MQLNKIKKILRENKEDFQILEKYDKTGELPFQRKKLNLTLSVETINELKELRNKTGKPISRIVENIIHEKIFNKNNLTNN